MTYAFNDYCVCPACRSDFVFGPAGLECLGCHVTYEIRQGVPILLPTYTDDERRRYQLCCEEIARDDLVRAHEPHRDVRHRELIRFIGDLAGKRVLDIGSSNALYLRELPAAFRVGFDIAYPYLAAIPGSPTLARVCGDAECLPFRPGFFDVIIVSDILEHVIDPEALVRSVTALCGERTRLIVEVPWEEDLRAYRDEKYEFTHLRRFDAYTFSTLWSGFYIVRRGAGMPYLEHPIFFQVDRRLPLSVLNFLRFIYHHEEFGTREYDWRRRLIDELPRRGRRLLWVCRPMVRHFELRNLWSSRRPERYRRWYQRLRRWSGVGSPSRADVATGTGAANGAGDQPAARVGGAREALARGLASVRPDLARWIRRRSIKDARGGSGSIQIRAIDRPELTAVDAYWGRHTVNSAPFTSPRESERYLAWRFDEYPLFRELMGLYGDHTDEVILDYGCGPGDDLVGFLLYTRARKVIGVDVSAKALALARARLELHGINGDRVELIESSDAVGRIPLNEASVDYVHCGGVLHHVSDPVAILREFQRVLRPGRGASVMVYNRDSLWFHLYTAYVRMVVEGAFTGWDVEAAFSRSTDGEACPISRAYAPDAFIRVCETVGFRTEFAGGYLSRHELSCWRKFGSDALRDSRLGQTHRDFLRRLIWDEHGYPMLDGRHAGIGGVYRLRRP